MVTNIKSDVSKTEETRTYWNNVYLKSEVKNLGWFEKISEPSLQLIQKCNLKSDDKILDIGSGATTLIGSLIDNGYSNITALDISHVALDIAKENLDPGKADQVKWVVDDITDLLHLNSDEPFKLWHDRTVLHFLTDKGSQSAYLSNLKKFVANKGYVIIAVFSLRGAKKCSGLDVKNYDAVMLHNFIGNEFELLDSFDYNYIQPSGNSREIVYTLFKRNGDL